jgi:hypothetical protein
VVVHDIAHSYAQSNHIRPKPSESTGSRPLSLSQAEERRTSSWVGDDQRIPGVVCFFGSLVRISRPFESCYIISPVVDGLYIRPKPLENTGSRPLSLSQAEERRTSSWVGDDQRIPGVVCLFFLFY